MTPSALTQTIAQAASLAALALLLGCPSSGAVPGRDGGRDAGPRPDGLVLDNCGGEGEACCGGNLCGPSLTCASGTCTAYEACGREAEPCCAGLACQTGLVCDEDVCARSEVCGGSGQACCAGVACQAGLVCEGGTCNAVGACGGARQPCCEGGACAAGLACREGTCETASACGGARQPCCASGAACQLGLVCVEGTCETDAAACGEDGQACCAGDACSGALACCSGRCADLETNAAHCGACGEACATTCTGGECDVACGGAGEACCAGDTCASGLSCQSGVCDKEVPGCKAARESCGAAGECCTGLNCRGEPAASCCVEANGACTAAADCCGALLCTDGRCTCRGSAQPCTATLDCCSGLACVDGVCSTEEDPCAGMTACGECAASPGCGWCDATDTCHSGNFFGPFEGTCGDWDWYSSACDNTDVCSSLASCEDCLGRPGCGFCATDAICRAGTSEGPTGTTCVAWQWSLDACGSDPCSTTLDCTSCKARSGCGWCDGADECMSGTFSGPSVGECPSDWDYSLGICDSTDACLSETDCASCNARGGCGWCASTGVCQAGTADGPSSGVCSTWKPSAALCTDPCGAATNCFLCNERRGCGWCASTHTCVSGGMTGPDEGSCSSWTPIDDECPSTDSCNFFDNCADCKFAYGCGWCDSTDLCMTGGYWGPEVGGCTDWDYTSWGLCDNSDACNSSTQCGDCTAREGCGWCEDGGGSCRAGSVVGPSSGGCINWDWETVHCA